MPDRAGRGETAVQVSRSGLQIGGGTGERGWLAHLLQAGRTCRERGWFRNGAGSRSPLGRDFGAVWLEQAFELDGCPICTLADKADYRLLWILLWENVNDPGIRDRLRASLGFCGLHNQRLVDITRAESFGPVGSAILAQDWIEAMTRRLARAVVRDERHLTAALAGSAPCLACEHRRFDERYRLSDLGRWMGDPGFRARYERSGGICVPHLLALPPSPSVETLLVDGLLHLRRVGAASDADAAANWAELEWRVWGWHPRRLPDRSALLDCPACRQQLAAERAALAVTVHHDQPVIVCPAHGDWLRTAPTSTGARPCAHPLLGRSYRAALAAGAAAIEHRLTSIATAERCRHRWWQRGSVGPTASSMPSCAICDRGAEVSRAVVKVGFDPDDLLCLEHLRQALSEPGRREIASFEIPRLTRLAKLLREFIRKSDWNRRHEPRGEEQGSWPRAAAFLTGYRPSRIPESSRPAITVATRGADGVSR